MWGLDLLIRGRDRAMWLVLGSMVVACTLTPLYAAQPAAEASTCGPWTRWQAFKQSFISPEGRVVDVGSSDSRTVSEGQAYGLFFALVANDRATFDRLLAATEDLLGMGRPFKRLPAWLWGQRPEGGFGILDENSASDADLWIAYALLQAGRLWHEARFSALGTSVARQVLARETAHLPGLGLTVLPGADGFAIGTAAWRLNPSYLPLQVLRGIAAAAPAQRGWAGVVASSQKVLQRTAPRGFAPDWVLYERLKGERAFGFRADPATHATGSYNAIRVYLWLGMLSPKDSATERLLALYRPMADFVRARGYPPEEVDAARGTFGKNAGNAGFSAAVVPFLMAQGAADLAQAQVERVAQLEAGHPSGYYSQVLALFGLGWQAGRFRFAPDGQLSVAWNRRCLRGHS